MILDTIKTINDSIVQKKSEFYSDFKTVYLIVRKMRRLDLEIEKLEKRLEKLEKQAEGL